MKMRVNSTVLRLTGTGWLWLAGFGFSGGWAQNSPAPELVKRCAAVAHEQALQQRNPLRKQQVAALNQRLLAVNGANLRTKAADDLYRIPVVVHVIHSNTVGTVGGAGNANISDEQILSQIQVLNEDYRRQMNTNGYNTEAIGADTGIEFFLAQTDPQGQATTGITRHYYSQKTSFDIYKDDGLLSQIAYWPSNRYLNIWVAPLENNYLGYGQFPSAADTLKGLDASSNEATDGVMIDYRYFGRNLGTVISANYNLGRTTTHEIGHWLGLIHPNGDADCGDDYVADTPPTEKLNQTTECTQTYSNCNGTRTRDLIEDYMDYSPDRCMNLFTQGQRDRMRNVLANSARRAELIQSLNALPEADVLTVNLYPNPVLSSDATAEVLFRGLQDVAIGLYDLTGRPVRSLQYPNAPSTRVTLPVTGLPPGLYVMRVSAGSQRQSLRVLVQ